MGLKVSARATNNIKSRGRVCSLLLRCLPRQNFKCVIDDAQPPSFQVVMLSPLTTYKLALSQSSIVLTGSSGWAYSPALYIHVFVNVQSSRFSLTLEDESVSFLGQSDVRSDDDVHVLPWQHP